MLLDLTRRYCEPHRSYHDIRHIAQMLTWGCEIGLDEAQVLAVWFHDAIYDAKSSRNEEDSAELAQRLMTAEGHPQSRIDTVTRIVLDTKRHVPTSDASAAVLDLDLGSLALPWPEFLANTAAIRSEYAHVADADFKVGRRQFMAKLLERPRLYYTPWGMAREATARANIARLVAELGS